MAVEALTLPEKPEALAWPEKARLIKIVDQRSYEVAANMLQDIATLRKAIIADFEEPKKKAFEAHKAVVAQESKHLKPLLEAETLLKQSIGAWDAEQERIRRAEEERLREVARQREEEERLAAAVEAEQMGAGAEEVAAVLETPSFTPQLVVAPPTYRRVEGISTREQWSAQVFNLKELCRAIADGKASHTLVQPDMKALNQMARALKTGMNIPGVRAVQSKTVAVR